MRWKEEGEEEDEKKRQLTRDHCLQVFDRVGEQDEWLQLS